MLLKRLIAFATLFLAGATLLLAQQSQNELYFLTHPAPSPDGSSVVFTFEGDLWQVSSQGGNASRLTGMPGEETHARFSPNGHHIAFSASQDGNTSVYIMPVGGGDIQRLTWHDGSNLVNSWSWDSKHVRFASDRYNYIDSYEVSINGSTPRRLINDHFFNLPHDIAEHPQTGDFYFTDTWESFRFYERKRYRGPFNPLIRSYNPETDVFTEHTTHDGKNMWISIDENGTIYYVSDEYNNEYNLFRLTNGQPELLTSFDHSIKYPQVSADGSVVVFEKNYQIWKYDVATGESSVIPVYLNRNPVLQLPVSFSTVASITNFDVSPDNKKLAFVSRGELFVSDISGEFVRQMPTTRGERVNEVIWTSENDLMYTQTWGGYHNLFKTRASGNHPEIQLTELEMHHRNLTLSPDKQKVAYFRGRNDVLSFDIKAVKSTLLHQDELWSFRNQSLNWSPDGRFLAFNAFRFFEHDIFVYDFEESDVYNLTQTGVSESSPFFSADGKFLYFNSDRIQPSYPRGNNNPDIWRIALTPQERPSRLDEFDELFKNEEENGNENENDNNEEENNDVSVTIDYDNLHRRWEQITRHNGSQSGPYVVTEGNRHTIVYGSAHDAQGPSLWKTVIEPFKSPETSKFDNVRTMSTDIREAGGSYYILISGTIHSLNIDSGSSTAIRIQHSFSRNLESEFRQIFQETWANLEENFYDEDFHGHDWREVRRHYEQFLPHLNSRSDLRTLTNDMLGELNSSHMGFNTGGPEESLYYTSTTLATGILFKNDDPFVVDRIVSGSNAEQFGLHHELQQGDVLRAVNGQRVNFESNREKYFSRPGGNQELELTFMRGRAEFTYRVESQSSASIRNLIYDEWMDSRQKIVDEQSGRSIAYIHMKNMGAGELRHFQQELARQTPHTDGLILDLRYNRGGNVHDDVIQALSRKTYLNWQFRGGVRTGQPNFAPSDYPIVVLINEQSLSDAEMTAAGLRELGIGTLMGMPTYRWIIFTTAMSLVDNSTHRLPAWGAYTFDNDNLELTGVEPEIRVRNTFHDLIHDRDPQLDEAIRYIINQRE